jgi:cell division transport system permease protein
MSAPASTSTATSPAAVAAPLRPRSRIAAWFEHHGYSIVASLGRMLRKPGSTLLTVGVMAIALALPLGLAIALDNLARLGGTLDESREISVFLKPEVEAAQAQALADRLRVRADVAAVELRTPAQGLAVLQGGDPSAQTLDDATRGMYADAIAALGENPLPSVLILRPRGDDAALARDLAGLAETDLVQRDAVWRERLARWLGFGERLVWVLAALLGLGALLVVGNTVRLDIQDRREEIAVLQLLGATDGFIRRPFLYLGLWYGLAAGGLALGLLTLAEQALREPLRALAASYGSGFGLHGVDPLQAAIVLGAAAVLGWLGAGLAAGHFLRQTRSG